MEQQTKGQHKKNTLLQAAEANSELKLASALKSQLKYRILQEVKYV